MSADPAKVMELRRATAAALYAKVADPKAATAENVKALAEAVAYADEAPQSEAFRAALEAYRANPGSREEVMGVNSALDILVRAGAIAGDLKVKQSNKSRKEQ